MTVRTAVFDAYGTLFDVAAAARSAASEPHFTYLQEIWPQLAADWRAKQIQYTWLRAITGYHTDFWQMTEDALDWVLETHDQRDPALRRRLLDLYRELSAYPEVAQMLRALKDDGVTTAIVSNGERSMLDAAVASAGIGDLLDDVISIDDVGVFKPDAHVYRLVGDRLRTQPRHTLFVSSNGWDVRSAAAFGFRTLWVNREGAAPDRLPLAPEVVESDLSGVPDLVRGHFSLPADPEPADPSTFTTDDGVRLAYRDEGYGPVLLCLAGLTRNMRDFDDVARELGLRARVLRMDARGRGASDNAADHGDYNVAQEAEDAIALLDHLGIDRAAILGTSRGGLIALHLAETHSDRLSGVCFNDVGPDIAAAGLAGLFDYVGITPAFADLEEAADGLKAAAAGTAPGVPRAHWRRQADRIWRETDGGLALRYDPRLRDALADQASGSQGAPDRWAQFDALAGKPVALIRGENSDILAPETAQAMQGRRPDMACAEVPRRGHVPFLDEPESRRVLDTFLTALDPGR